MCGARGVFVAVVLGVFCVSAWGEDPPKTEGGAAEAPADTTNYKELKSPIPYSEASIKKARVMYMRLCTECHGQDGKAQIDVIADASDLTNTKLYRNGFTEGEIFKSIKKGAGTSMPPFESQLKDDDTIWHLVNFVRSLWPKDQRPALVAPETTEPNASQPKDAENKDGESSKDGE